LAIHAHPDDESSKGAGTYAKYVRAGAEVMIVSATGGERGDIQNEGLVPKAMANRDMGGIRRIEMAEAQAAVGFQHRWLGYQDSGLPDGFAEDRTVPLPPNSFYSIPLELSAEPLVRIIREFRPQVVITYDETGGYPHPDHIRTHEISMYAIEAAADAGRYPDAGEPWTVSKVYYDRTFNAGKVTAMYPYMVESATTDKEREELEGFLTRIKERPDVSTTHIDIGDFLEVRDAALRAHASQVPPDSRFFFWPHDVQLKAWPYEDYQLVSSRVESALPESDLFAGVES
jgi:mycothiol S-conjugate amidase